MAKKVVFLKRENDLIRQVRAMEGEEPCIPVTTHLYINGHSVEEAVKKMRQAAEMLDDPTVQFEKESCYCYSYDCSCSEVLTIQGTRGLTEAEKLIWEAIEEKQAELEAQQAEKNKASAAKAKATRLAKEKKEYERLKKKFG